METAENKHSKPTTSWKEHNHLASTVKYRRQWHKNTQKNIKECKTQKIYINGREQSLSHYAPLQQKCLGYFIVPS